MITVLTAHDIMVKLSGVPAGSLPSILANRIAGAANFHQEYRYVHALAERSECRACAEAWPCTTYKILTGEESL